MRVFHPISVMLSYTCNGGMWEPSNVHEKHFFTWYTQTGGAQCTDSFHVIHNQESHSHVLHHNNYYTRNNIGTIIDDYKKN